jgi:hypothetical protein
MFPTKMLTPYASLSEAFRILLVSSSCCLSLFFIIRIPHWICQGKILNLPVKSVTIQKTYIVQYMTHNSWQECTSILENFARQAERMCL